MRDNPGVIQSASVEYRARVSAHSTTRDALNRSDAHLAHARLATFAAAALLGVVIWRSEVSAGWLIVPAAIFLWLVRRHDRILRGRDGATRAIAFYERGLARLEDRWIGTGDTGERFRDDGHVYANDLDLFGRGSLFELLSLARTRTGEETLAGWLTSPADAPGVLTRQAAVAELTPCLDLREQLALAGADVRAGVQTDRLLEWAESPMRSERLLRVCTWMFTAAAAAAILHVTITGTWWPLAALVTLQTVVFHRLRPQMNAILSGNDPDLTANFVADSLSRHVLGLDIVADLLKDLERQKFSSEGLRLLHGRLSADGVPASGVIRRLHRFAELGDSEKSAAALPLGLFLLGELELALSAGVLLQLLRPHVALAVTQWRTRHGARVRVWLETVAHFEALTSLAAYRYEHIDDPFPEIVQADDDANARALFQGVQLGHPLIPAAQAVRNDVHLTGATQLFVVSGSNMSGKSTLLRTVGINVVLALAGAPVRAASLRLTPVAIGATLRIQDSLLEGRSRFYAEITRIRTVADIAAGPVPLLFLLDELFHGTNSHDRLQGAAGVLQSLLDRGAIGLITTHDLALTSVADELSPRAANVHFADWFEKDDIRFDYRMKPGPVTRSNALALMRVVGLDVPSQA